MKKKKPVLGLVCVGGGAHGAYQVGVLKYVHEHFSRGEASPFQIFTGCSCGSLNTSFFASHSNEAKQARLELEDLWINFHIKGYHGNKLKSALALFLRQMKTPRAMRLPAWSLLDPVPMEKVIEKGFKREGLDEAMRLKTTLALGVIATELISGRACWFVEGPNALDWNLFHSIGKIDRITMAHIAASCSVPIFLPPVQVGERWFSDGSVSIKRPLSAAIDMGAQRILSIGTDKPYPDELPTYSSNFKPKISNVLRMLMNRLSYDAAADEATQIEVFNQFHHDLSRKALKIAKSLESLPLFHEEAMPSHYKPVEIYQIHPSKRIKTISIDADYGKGEFVKHKSTRFRFHKTFIRNLIEMGYEDAKHRHDDLVKLCRDSDEDDEKANWKTAWLKKK